MTELRAVLLRLAAGALICGVLLHLGERTGHTEILRFACACLMIVLLLTTCFGFPLPSLPLDSYEKDVRQSVNTALENQQALALEQTQARLEAALEQEATALGLTCKGEVSCSVDDEGLVSVTAVLVRYRGGDRGELGKLLDYLVAQFGVSKAQVTIQEG